MPSYEPPPLIAPSLRALRDYMHVFYPERARTAPIPLDFWSEPDDETFLEILGYLPLHLTDDALARLDELPDAFRIAYPIFRLEDDYEVNGWTALLNAGEDLLPSAVAAYERVDDGRDQRRHERGDVQRAGGERGVQRGPGLACSRRRDNGRGY